MPIYEYECPNCGKHFEIFQKFSDEPLSRCQECGGHVHKLISKTSFILKGTGWYATDYASPVRKKAKEAKEAKDKSGSKAETKTETKSALKEEAAVKK
jgi:putative FmdB family regulatory protein